MPLQGILNFPGDKSLSHRALMLAALAQGESIIDNLSTGDDVRSTRRCLQACGVNIRSEGKKIMVQGGTLTPPETALDCGNSGTTVRLLAGLLAGQGITATFTGDASLSRRPMQRIIDPLEKMGVTCRSNGGYLPLTIIPRRLRGIDYTLPVASAQVKSCILLAALGAEGQTTVHEPVATRDHTERLLNHLGHRVQSEGRAWHTVSARDHLPPFQFHIPGDPSTAAFFTAAAMLVPGSEVRLAGISRNPTRTEFFTVLQSMGGQVTWSQERTTMGEPVGDLTVKASSLRGVQPAGEQIPGLIDEIPILAILATQANGLTRVRGAEELRVKECDRIQAIVDNLQRMGAHIREARDGFDIQGPTSLTGTDIHTHHDHRIAMAFSVAGLISEGPVVLDDRDCVNISSPEFFNRLEVLKQ